MPTPQSQLLLLWGSTLWQEAVLMSKTLQKNCGRVSQATGGRPYISPARSLRTNILEIFMSVSLISHFCRVEPEVNLFLGYY